MKQVDESALDPLAPSTKDMVGKRGLPSQKPAAGISEFLHQV